MEQIVFITGHGDIPIGIGVMKRGAVDFLAKLFLVYARSHSVHLVVLDVWMPEASGVQVQAQLGKVSPDTKVIVMTGRETPAVRAAALEGGAFALLRSGIAKKKCLALGSAFNSILNPLSKRLSSVCAIGIPGVMEDGNLPAT